ncbi:MAG TPA: efflux RND transporter periplasmic adaptor subunit [Methyloceanibacter sp.]|nr:efflux RND transporter periplasmic adaptor subunit [Methyloceanibacter sp.]
MKKFGLPLLALVALIFAAASAWKWRSVYKSTPPPLPPPTAGFQRTVGAVGLVEASSENIAISTPVPGLAVKVYVKAGERVKAGQKLFSLDDRDLLAELEVRRAALEVARQKLAKLEQAPRAEEIPPAEARVREAEAALADAAVQQRLIESVTDKRAIREEDLQRRRLAAKAAAARLDEARAALALLKSGAWEPDLKIARADVAQAGAQVRRLETDIERLSVRAPMAGEILQLNVRAGEYAQAGGLTKPLIVMGDTSRLHVRADVDENEAWRIRAGASAQASERGAGGRKVQLEFVRFEPYVTPKKSLTGDSTERVDTRVLQVIYRFKDPSVPFRVGQQMDVFIATDQQRGEP